MFFVGGTICGAVGEFVDEDDEEDEYRDKTGGGEWEDVDFFCLEEV